MQSRGVSRAGFGILASIIFLAAGLALVPTAHAQGIQWTRQFRSSGFDSAYGISVDASGIYVAGRTDRTLPGQTSAGFTDAYVRKYDANGSEVWTRQFGSPNFDRARGISVDASGIYVAGFTSRTLPGQTSSGSVDAFVRKYDANGSEVWTRQFGSTDSDQAFGISVDASGIYVAGFTTGTLPGQTSSGSVDAFVRKYDANGNEIWTRQFGSSRFDRAIGISVDASGIYVAGRTKGTLPGQTSASSAGFSDAFVRKYDANGNEIWTRQFGSSSFDSAYGISVDASGIYVVGYTERTLPGQTSSGSGDAFVCKYDANGSEVWTRQFGSSRFDRAYGISVDASGIYVVGYTERTLPGQTSSGSGDAFVRKYDANGNEVWTRQFGNSDSNQAFGISVDASGIYVAGRTEGIRPGDAFVVKLVVLTPAEAIQQLIADVVALNLKQGISNSLDSKLDAAVQALDDPNQNNDVAAINALQAFINAVEAQRGIHIPEADAIELIAATQQIIALLGG